MAEVEKMGEELAQTLRLHNRMATEVRHLLEEFSSRGEELQPVARQCGAAIPAWEPLDYRAPLPPVPDSFTVIAADGSQIQPDRHGIALYYVINVGSIMFRHGSGQTPEVHSTSRIFYKDEDLYEGRRLVQGNLLDVRRDTAELRELADRVEEVADEDQPVVALADGTLLLWVLEEDRKRHLDKVQLYLKEMERIKATGTALAGFISRPRYTEVVDLLWLASLGKDASPAKLDEKPWGRFTDAALFAFLQEGERSALFESPSPLNDLYGPHRVYFFYLKTGNEVARVEVPEWVARDEKALDLVHSAIIKQGEITGGYPYVLTRAHELAVIGRQERENLEQMIERALIRRGIMPRTSEKERWKRMMA